MKKNTRKNKKQNRALRKPESEEGKILIKTKLYKLDKKCVLINELDLMYYYFKILFVL